MISRVFHPSARQEQLDLMTYFEKIGPETAKKFRRRIDHTLSRISQMPELYREQFQGIRVVSLRPGFGDYFVAYFTHGTTVVILAIGNAKREPFYFANRLRTKARRRPMKRFSREC